MMHQSRYNIARLDSICPGLYAPIANNSKYDTAVLILKKSPNFTFVHMTSLFQILHKNNSLLNFPAGNLDKFVEDSKNLILFCQLHFVEI